MNESQSLRQSVRWGEPYVSSALNRKFAGILSPGIYHGYDVQPGGGMNVKITHESDYPSSVAIVDRDKYSLTVIMDDPVLVPINGSGEWLVCIEALYRPNAQGYQRIVARKTLEQHNVPLARVMVPEEADEITEEMIDTSIRVKCLSQLQLSKLATLELAGRVKPDGSTISIKPDGTVSVAQGSHWLLGEFYFFRHPEPRPGFEVLDGGVIENGADMYPEFWQYIQTSEGQLLCKTAAERVELANHIYYTLADGFTITYGGIGGIPFYTIDTATGKITMPDIRGMHLEAAGFDSLNAGGVAIDATRAIFGWLGNVLSNANNAVPQAGASFYWAITNNGQYSTFASCTSGGGANPEFNSTRYVPVASVNRPRSFGALACAYMGTPAL